MATFNVSRAAGQVLRPRFMVSVASVVVGALASQMLTDWARSNVVDLSMPGADAVYSAIAAIIALAILPSKFGKPLAMGMAASGTQVALQDFGVL